MKHESVRGDFDDTEAGIGIEPAPPATQSSTRYGTATGGRLLQR